jgi:ribosomal protein L20
MTKSKISKEKRRKKNIEESKCRRGKTSKIQKYRKKNIECAKCRNVRMSKRKCRKSKYRKCWILNETFGKFLKQHFLLVYVCQMEEDIGFCIVV